MTMRDASEVDRELLRIASMFAVADLREESSTRLHVRGVQLFWVLNPNVDWLQAIALFAQSEGLRRRIFYVEKLWTQ